MKCLIVMLMIMVVDGRIELNNNQYQGVVVALDPIILPSSTDDQAKVIQDIKTVLTSTSAALLDATFRRAYLGDLTLVIPGTWDPTLADDTATASETWSGAHIRIVTEGGQNNAPYAIKAGGCGVQGVSVEIPYPYLTSTEAQAVYGSTGKTMVQAWLGYRYGVHSESGYPGDPVYPHGYLHPLTATTRPTGCTDHDTLTGAWIDRTGETCEPLDANGGSVDPECRYRVEGAEADFSVMYLTHVDQIKQVCTPETHDPYSPTPHNRLCGGASVWEVMSRHQDFAEGQNLPLPDTPQETAPTVRLVQSATGGQEGDAAPALFLLVDHNCGDNTETCDGIEVYNQLRPVLRGVLEGGTIAWGGIAKYFTNRVGYYDKAQVIVPITEATIDGIVNYLPPNSKTDATTTPENALTDVLNNLGKSEYRGEINILLVQMVGTVEEGSSLQDITNDNVTVTGVLYGASEDYNPWMPQLTEATGGSYYYSATYAPLVVQEALLSLVPGGGSTDSSITLAKEEITSVTAPATVTAEIDATLGLQTTFTAQFTTMRGTMKVVDPSGGETSVADPYSLLVEDAAVGTWKVIVQNQIFGGQATVEVISNPRPDVSQVTVVTWSSAPTDLTPLNLSTTNLVLYTSVTQGGKGVTGLKVTVNMYKNADSEVVPVELKDDGLGDPDVSLYDGVYSGYVTDYKDQAEELPTTFYADVSVQPADGGAVRSSRKTQPRNPQSRQEMRLLPEDPFATTGCCGSVSAGGVAMDVSRTITSATMFTTVGLPFGGEADAPPSRISYLTGGLATVEGRNAIPGYSVQVDLLWTAPGKDLTEGQVTGYEVWYSESLQDITQDYTQGTMLESEAFEVPPVPAPYGSAQSAKVTLPRLPDLDTQYFIVVLGLDADQQGPASPAVGVVASAQVPTTTASTPDSTTATEPTDNSQSTSDPSTSNPSTSDPSTSDPSTPDPSTSDPSTSNPSTSDPSTPDPSTSDPSTPDPSTSDPSTPDPSTPDPSTSDPSTPDPSTSNPITPDPSTSDPSTPDPSTSDPSTPDSSSSDPSTSDPSTSNPSTNSPSTSDPTISNSPDTSEQPGTTQPPGSTEDPPTNQPPGSTEDPPTNQPPGSTEDPPTNQPPGSTEDPPTSPPTDPPGGNDFVGSAGFYAIIGVSSAAVLILVVLAVFCTIKKRRSKLGGTGRLESGLVDSGSPKETKAGTSGPNAGGIGALSTTNAAGQSESSVNKASGRGVKSKISANKNKVPSDQVAHEDIVMTKSERKFSTFAPIAAAGVIGGDENDGGNGGDDARLLSEAGTMGQMDVINEGFEEDEEAEVGGTEGAEGKREEEAKKTEEVNKKEEAQEEKKETTPKAAQQDANQTNEAMAGMKAADKISGPQTNEENTPQTKNEASKENSAHQDEQKTKTENNNEEPNKPAEKNDTEKSELDGKKEVEELEKMIKEEEDKMAEEEETEEKKESGNEETKREVNEER